MYDVSYPPPPGMSKSQYALKLQWVAKVAPRSTFLTPPPRPSRQKILSNSLHAA